MIPSTIHSSVKSGAERRLFKVIKEIPDSEAWACLHSLALARHDTKRRGEIDFFLLSPLGLYVLEVKGGRIRREGGVWIHIDRFGLEHRRPESPFDQAASAMFSVERGLQGAFAGSPIADALFGYGVMLPDVEFDALGLEGDRNLVYDARDRGRPVTEYLRRLAEFTRKRQTRPRRVLTPKQIGEVTDYLGGDFDLVPSFQRVAEDIRAQLTQLTLEQRTVLDATDSDPRLIIEGPAGSGKTVLALEAARREARLGRSVLLLCYNRMLAAFMRSELDNEQYSGKLVVRTVHAQFRHVIEASSLAEEFSKRSAQATDEDLYGSMYPEYAAMAAMEADAPPFDVLIVDEAQDVISDANIQALTEMLQGGLAEGRWRLFLDANNQACVYGRMEPKALDRIRRLGRSLLLTANCRNTRPIAIQTNVVADPERKTAGRVEGKPVEYTSYERDEQCLGKLENVLNCIRQDGTPPGHVTVLFPHSPNEEQVRRLGHLGVRRLQDDNVNSLGTDKLPYLTWSSVSGFKGLENDVIVLVGIHDIQSDWGKAVTYVGMSRARVRLHVISHVACDPIRETRFARELQRQLESES